MALHLHDTRAYSKEKAPRSSGADLWRQCNVDGGLRRPFLPAQSFHRMICNIDIYQSAPAHTRTELIYEAFGISTM